MPENVVSTPTRKRAVTSYAARTQYKAEPVRALSVRLKDAIDIHCHAHEGQQDACALARRASEVQVGVGPGVPCNAAPGFLGGAAAAAARPGRCRRAPARGARHR